MNFHTRRRVIDEGDLVLFYVSPRNMKVMKIANGQAFMSSHGMIPHVDVVGKRYGARVQSKNCKLSAVLLQLTTELWSGVLPHRTQIVYPTDMAIVAMELDLCPGKRVVESGTGSGSMTHSLSRAVGPSGKVYTFEYHEQRVSLAVDEFKEHLLTNVVVQHRDICSDGFVGEGMEQIQGTIDAVFLDVPCPWKALKHTLCLFRPNSVARICCFSPCIEQVQKNCETLAQLGFTDIKMVECLERRMEARNCKMLDADALMAGNDEEFIETLHSRPPFPEAKAHTAYLTFATYLPQSAPLE